MAPDRTRHTRRSFLQGSLTLVGLGLAFGGCGTLPLGGRQPAKVPRVGVLSALAADFPRTVQYREAFLAGLRALGHEEGRSIAIDFRYAAGQPERLPELAAELVRLPVDVLVVQGDPAMGAARQASDSIPIVFALHSAPVESGVVASLSRPGGNITGLTEITPELSGKRLELLREAVPGLARAGVVWSPQFPGPALQFQELELAARAVGVELLRLSVRGPEEFEAAFDAAGGRAEAFVVLPSSVTTPHANRILELVARSRLPAIYGERLWVDAGGLMSYGANVADMWRRAATYVDKILKGARPADLPVERPDRLDSIVNLKTAQALGLAIPPSVLQQATEVIQ